MDDSLGKECLHDAGIWIWEADQRFLEAAKIKRRLMLCHSLFEALNVAVDVFVEQ